MRVNQSSMRAFIDETHFKNNFLIDESKNYTKSEGISVVNYVGLHVWTLALDLLVVQ